MKNSTSRTVSAKVLHSIVSVLLVFAMIFGFSACQSDTVDPNETVNIGGGSEGEHNTPAQTADLSRLVRISLTIDATRAYNNASLPQNIKDGLQNEGMLIKNAMLTLSEGKTVAETFSLLRTYDIVIVSESGAAGASQRGQSRMAVLLRRRNGRRHVFRSITKSMPIAPVRAASSAAVWFVCCGESQICRPSLKKSRTLIRCAGQLLRGFCFVNKNVTFQKGKIHICSPLQC